LKKLRTSYIDLLYVHWWDYSTTIEEVMLSLNDLVKAGKVMYLGVSDAPGASSRHRSLPRRTSGSGLWMGKR
jgi:aryl-alcohol dehydrogenase-like predicted oxidoreductase